MVQLFCDRAVQVLQAIDKGSVSLVSVRRIDGGAINLEPWKCLEGLCAKVHLSRSKDKYLSQRRGLTQRQEVKTPKETANATTWKRKQMPH